MYCTIIPFGCSGGSHETKMESPVKASALIPAGGPGTVIKLTEICYILILLNK